MALIGLSLTIQDIRRYAPELEHRQQIGPFRPALFRVRRQTKQFNALLRGPTRCYYGDQRSFSMRYTVVLEREADGGYVATVPALPGCVSQGDTCDEATRNIREAADLYIEDCIAAGDPVPTEAGREYLELVTSSPR